MFTIFLYVVIIALVAGALFLVASLTFGRGEAVPAIGPNLTATVLPADGITGSDVDALKFQQTLRGYKAAEVDWALDQLGNEIDELRSRVAVLEAELAQAHSATS